MLLIFLSSSAMSQNGKTAFKPEDATMKSLKDEVAQLRQEVRFNREETSEQGKQRAIREKNELLKKYNKADPQAVIDSMGQWATANPGQHPPREYIEQITKRSDEFVRKSAKEPTKIVETKGTISESKTATPVITGTAALPPETKIPRLEDTDNFNKYVADQLATNEDGTVKMK